MRKSADLPRTAFPDSTLALLRDGYEFIGKRCRRYGSDAFRTRIMLEDVICVTGVEAAEVFYGADRFDRRHAVPVTVLKLLQDRGSVQSLEDAAHRHRKQLFLSMTADAEAGRLTGLFAGAWTSRLETWRDRDEVILYDEVFALLTEAACAWLGITLSGDALRQRTEEARAMIEGAGSVGPRNWRALFLRRRAERWARGLVIGTRKAGDEGQQHSPLRRLAWHRALDGSLLPPEIAAVELLNLLRPTAAVVVFIVFAALALHQHPHWAQAFARGEEDDLESFVQEVRRLAPFFPMIGGRSRRAFDWRGLTIPAGQWVLLDLYGTCRDPRAWDAPDAFRPERYRDTRIGDFSLVAQGGGDLLGSHRCPGEGIAVALMKQAVRLLTRSMTYRVPPQDLSVNLSRMPGRPRSGFVIADVRQGASKAMAAEAAR